MDENKPTGPASSAGDKGAIEGCGNPAKGLVLVVIGVVWLCYAKTSWDETVSIVIVMCGVAAAFPPRPTAKRTMIDTAFRLGNLALVLALLAYLVVLCVAGLFHCNMWWDAVVCIAGILFFGLNAVGAILTLVDWFRTDSVEDKIKEIAQRHLPALRELVTKHENFLVGENFLVNRHGEQAPHDVLGVTIAALHRAVKGLPLPPSGIVGAAEGADSAAVGTLPTLLLNAGMHSVPYAKVAYCIAVVPVMEAWNKTKKAAKEDDVPGAASTWEGAKGLGADFAHRVMEETSKLLLADPEWVALAQDPKTQAAAQRIAGKIGQRE